MDTDQDRVQAYRSRLRQARRLAQILARRRRYKTRRLSLAPVSFLLSDDEGAPARRGKIFSAPLREHWRL